MKHLILILTAAVILCFSASATSAGDYASLNFIGFSNDGKYLAFEEYGVQDGSGFPYSDLYFIDVAKNAFAAPPVKTMLDNESATEDQARARTKRLAAASLKKFRIVQGNTGKLVVSRLLTDLSLDDDAKIDAKGSQKIRFADEVGSMYTGNTFDLTLTGKAATTDDCGVLDEPAEIFELSFKYENKQSGAEGTVVLQKDTTLPKARGCAFGYSVRSVYLYKNSIAVFLNTYTRGFEGPDLRYLAVTGKYL
jgi:predicted secreted protein